MRKKELLALLASAVAVVIVLTMVTGLVSPKRHSFGSDWGEFLQEPEHSLDVLFIGSSLTYCNIIPALFWEETGLTAWDLTGPELTVPGAYYYLKEALNTQSPSVVFIEISAALYSRYTGFTKTVIGQMPWGRNRLEMTFGEGEQENLMGLLFPMFFYHSRWTELSQDDIHVFLKGYEQDLDAGYTYLNQYRVMEEYRVRDDSGLDPENNERNLEFLLKIAQLCRQEGITPVFYESPAVATMPAELMDPIRQTLAGIEGAVVVNFNDHRDAIGAEMEGDYYDSLHYNAAGAEKFTRYLAAWVTENLDVMPEGNGDAELWRSRVEYIEKLLQMPMTAA